MMSAEAIRGIAQESARKAKRNGQQPWHPETLEDINVDNLRSIPFLGTYTPKTWKADEKKTWFVDSSGFGQDGEAALTVNQFVEQAKAWFGNNPSGGFAITQAGQFQVYIGAYHRKAS